MFPKNKLIKKKNYYLIKIYKLKQLNLIINNKQLNQQKIKILILIKLSITILLKISKILFKIKNKSEIDKITKVNIKIFVQILYL